MANIKSAKKRVIVAQKRADRNKAVKALSAAISEINKAGSKGVYHKNTCARKVSRLTKAVNALD